MSILLLLRASSSTVPKNSSDTGTGTETNSITASQTRTETATAIDAGVVVSPMNDTFESYSAGVDWTDSSINGAWLTEFTGTNGLVEPVDVGGQGRVLQLEAFNNASTSSSLVRSLPITQGDVHYTTHCRTVAQLKTSPNPWEVIWFVWNYKLTGSNRSFYYVALKTNGFELGKVDQNIAFPGGQRFLWTDSTAHTVGTWYDLEVHQVGANIKVWVDGALRADFTDGVGSGGTPAWGTSGESVFTEGSVGMYHEDARVQFADITNVGGNQNIPGSDTGAGTETQSITASQTRTETGSGVDAGTVSATQTRTETATGTDALVNIAFTRAETGAGTEAQIIAAALSGADTGAGTEGTPRIDSTRTETGSGVDTGTISASQTRTESGAGTESQSISLLVNETGSGTDTGTISANQTRTETGAFAETNVIYVFSSDSMSAAENTALVVNLSSAEIGNAVEATPASNMTRAETATATEASLISATLSSSDPRTVVDAQSSTAAISGSDTMTAVDDQSFDQTEQKSGSDTSSTVDIGSVQATLNSAQPISSLEGQSLSFAGQDSGQAQDSAQIGRTHNDSASFSETHTIYVISADGVTATDSQSLAAAVAQTDSAVLQDSWIVDATLASTDVLSAMEDELASEDTGLTAEFSAPFSDTYVRYVIPDRLVKFKMRTFTEEWEE